LTWLKRPGGQRRMLGSLSPHEETTLKTMLAGLLATGALAALPAAAQSIDYGQAEFAASCSGCHGATARGDGHFREYLNRAPADLTVLARGNGGVFPVQRVMQAIDGRNTVSGHGRAGEMPIWGAVYVTQVKGDPTTVGLAPEAAARMKIALLVDYLNRIQQR
jgi:mono/diheme cytochrome c family protein